MVYSLQLYEDSMAQEKGLSKCAICHHEYVSYEAKLCPDSHFTYTEYYACPKCQYNPETQSAIHQIIRHIEFDARLFEGKLEFRVCTDKLEEELFELIKKVWPNPKGVQK
jgi:hypothetical protein